MNFELMEALRVIEREKGINFEVLLEALANALVTAYKRMPNAAEEALVEVDAESGEIRVVAQELDEEGAVVQEWDDTPTDFGRIAAQTAKQVILQRIREAEREMKYEEYAGRQELVVEAVGDGPHLRGRLALPREADEVDGVGGQRRRPDQPGLVVVLLHHRRHHPGDADAVAAHHHRVLLALLVGVLGAERH